MLEIFRYFSNFFLCLDSCVSKGVSAHACMAAERNGLVWGSLVYDSCGLFSIQGGPRFQSGLKFKASLTLLKSNWVCFCSSGWSWDVTE